MKAYVNRIYESAKCTYELAKRGDKRILYSYEQFYNRGTQNPCLARIIFNDIFDKGFKKNRLEGYAAVVNVSSADKTEYIKDSLHRYAEAFRDLYPKSEWIRRYSLDNKRVVRDNVKGKAGWFHKFKVGKFMENNKIETFFKG